MSRKPYVSKTPVERQKPRHVPSFCSLRDSIVEKLIKTSSRADELQQIMGHYEVGTIGLRRYAVTHQDEVDGFIADFSKRSTRLSNDTADRTVVTVGFSGRKKRWTLCPSSECIPKADKREKIVGQWKFLHLPPKGEELVVPRCVHEAYAEVVDDCAYFAATLCPQQTYCAKHSGQGAFLNRNWHYEYRHQFALQDFLVFCDHAQKVRAVWRLKTLQHKYAGGAETAEQTLIRVMYRVLDTIRITADAADELTLKIDDAPEGTGEDLAGEGGGGGGLDHSNNSNPTPNTIVGSGGEEGGGGEIIAGETPGIMGKLELGGGEEEGGEISISNAATVAYNSSNSSYASENSGSGGGGGIDVLNYNNMRSGNKPQSRIKLQRVKKEVKTPEEAEEEVDCGAVVSTSVSSSFLSPSLPSSSDLLAPGGVLSSAGLSNDASFFSLMSSSSVPDGLSEFALPLMAITSPSLNQSCCTASGLVSRSSPLDGNGSCSSAIDGNNMMGGSSSMMMHGEELTQNPCAMRPISPNFTASLLYPSGLEGEGSVSPCLSLFRPNGGSGISPQLPVPLSDMYSNNVNNGDICIGGIHHSTADDTLVSSTHETTAATTTINATTTSSATTTTTEEGSTNGSTTSVTAAPTTSSPLLLLSTSTSPMTTIHPCPVSSFCDPTGGGGGGGGGASSTPTLPTTPLLGLSASPAFLGLMNSPQQQHQQLRNSPNSLALLLQMSGIPQPPLHLPEASADDAGRHLSFPQSSTSLHDSSVLSMISSSSSAASVTGASSAISAVSSILCLDHSHEGREEEEGREQQEQQSLEESLDLHQYCLRVSSDDQILEERNEKEEKGVEENGGQMLPLRDGGEDFERRDMILGLEEKNQMDLFNQQVVMDNSSSRDNVEINGSASCKNDDEKGGIISETSSSSISGDCTYGIVMDCSGSLYDMKVSNDEAAVRLQRTDAEGGGENYGRGEAEEERRRYSESDGKNTTSNNSDSSSSSNSDSSSSGNSCDHVEAEEEGGCVDIYNNSIDNHSNSSSNDVRDVGEGGGLSGNVESNSDDVEADCSRSLVMSHLLLREENKLTSSLPLSSSPFTSSVSITPSESTSSSSSIAMPMEIFGFSGGYRELEEGGSIEAKMISSSPPLHEEKEKEGEEGFCQMGRGGGGGIVVDGREQEEEGSSGREEEEWNLGNVLVNDSDDAGMMKNEEHLLLDERSIDNDRCFTGKRNLRCGSVDDEGEEGKGEIIAEEEGMTRAAKMARVQTHLS